MGIKVVSTMGSGSLGREFDLESLVAALQEARGDEVSAEFNSSGMVTFRLEPAGPAYTLYRTGTFQVRGASSKESLAAAVEKVINALGELGVDVEGYDFEQKTSVFMTDIGESVNLEVLSVALGFEQTEYEPEQFPGLVYRPTEYGATVLVFASGKAIITGTTEMEEAEAIIRDLQADVSEFL